jgi:hypothetical protein
MPTPATYKFDESVSGFVQPVQDGRTAITYPFLPNGSIGPKVYTRNLLQREAYYVPATMGLERDSAWPDGDAQAYLIAESSPEWVGIGDMLRFSRTYARIPAVQTVYGSRTIVRPVMHDIFSGSSYAVSFDNGATSHVFTSRTTVSAVAAPDVPNTANPANGSTPGTLSSAATISFTGNNSTQTFAANASDSTIKDQLSTAVTGSTASSANFKIARNTGGITVSVVTTNTTISAISSDSATVIVTPLIVLGVASGSGAELFTLDATDANASSKRRVTTSIAAVAGRYMALWNGDKLAGWGKVVATDGSTYSDLELSEIPGKDFAATHAAVAGVTAGSRYVNGPVAVSTKEVTTFYLPLVTAGITTPSDITLVAPKLAPVDWLGEIVAYIAGGSLTSYYSAIEGSQLDRWLDDPIYSQTVISAQMSDALDTVSTSA